MAAHEGLRRLQGLRLAEEEQANLLLQQALGDLHKLTASSWAAQERLTHARALLKQSVCSDEPTARLSANEEIVGSRRLIKALSARIHIAEAIAERLRKDLLAKRLERRQAQILLASIIEEQDSKERRKAQCALDDWYRSRQTKSRPRALSSALSAPPDQTESR